MGTINSALNGYYQLANLLSSNSGSSTSSSTSQASSLQALETALLSSASGSSQSGNSNAYLLDLSPQAQQLLGGSSATTTSSSGSSTTFTLTSAQQTTIKNILAKYKDAPLTQATFDSIQNALQAAGLSPQTLGAEDQVKSFNATGELLNALNGNYNPTQTPSTTASGEQTKEANYMQSIVSAWKAEDSSTSSGGGTSGSNAVSSTAV